MFCVQKKWGIRPVVVWELEARRASIKPKKKRAKLVKKEKKEVPPSDIHSTKIKKKRAYIRRLNNNEFYDFLPSEYVLLNLKKRESGKVEI